MMSDQTLWEKFRCISRLTSAYDVNLEEFVLTNNEILGADVKATYHLGRLACFNRMSYEGEIIYSWRKNLLLCVSISRIINEFSSIFCSIKVMRRKSYSVLWWFNLKQIPNTRLVHYESCDGL